jgi:hypothetical protein
VLPVTLWVKLLIILAVADETPLTMVWKRFADEEATRVLMIEVVAEVPPIL